TTSGGPPTFSDASAMTATQYPSRPEPSSPMKILAGSQFQPRYPAAAAATSAAATAMDEAPTRYANKPPMVDTTSASDAAMPSIPSMKLKRLISQTTPSAPRTQPAAPSVSSPPPSSSEGRPPSSPSASDAAIKCTAARTSAETCRLYSTTPDPAISAPPATSAMNSVRSIQPRPYAALKPATRPAKMPIPPPRGVGSLCE